MIGIHSQRISLEQELHSFKLKKNRYEQGYPEYICTPMASVENNSFMTSTRSECWNEYDNDHWTMFMTPNVDHTKDNGIKYFL